MKVFILALAIFFFQAAAIAEEAPTGEDSQTVERQEEAAGANGFFTVAKTGKSYHIMKWWEALIVSALIIAAFHLLVVRAGKKKK